MNTIEWLSKLIAFDTTSRHSNLSLIEDVSAWFLSHGIEPHIIEDTKEKKANLIATLPASNGHKKGGLILSSHTDVVPVDGQKWESDPFKALEKNGRIYGRGACDMKGFLAATLALLPYFLQLKRLKPLHYALSYDEEVGCIGASFLIDELQAASLEPEACIVGEPTEMRPITAHKGIQVFKCHFSGLAMHSSLTPNACNAIDYAAELICYLRKLAEEFKQAGPKDTDFDVPFTSLSTNMIKGGIAANTVPDSCEFIFEFRHLPSVSAALLKQKIQTHIQTVLQPAMQKEYQQARIELHSLASVPSFEADSDATILNLARSLLAEQKNRKVAYATEAGLFQQANIPTIVLGPGSIEQAHGANEYIEISQLEKCETFLKKITAHFCG